MTFKKAEMAKTLENGLSMIQTNPLNHNWSYFVILLGLTLHHFQKKLLLRPKNFLLGSSLAFNLKEGPVRCAEVCDRSWVILCHL